jgi:spore germination protein GerM
MKERNTLFIIFLILILLVFGLVVFGLLGPGGDDTPGVNLTPSPPPAGEANDFPNGIVTPTEDELVMQVFFNNFERSQDCGAVFGVERTVPETETAGTVAMQLLLEGPTQEELAQGYISNIPDGTQLNSVNVTNGTAQVDFSAQLATAAGSCTIEAIRAQVEETMLQFQNVNEVVISVDGETEEILQP